MKYLLVMIIFWTISTDAFAQNPENIAPCRNRTIVDAERRDFTTPNSFSHDLDGDGKSDRITARIYKRKTAGAPRRGVKETHWISFDLTTTGGRTLKSFFKYMYGSNLADYWAFALVPCHTGGDARVDLLFYAGDDTSDETVILRNTGRSFQVQSRKVTKY